MVKKNKLIILFSLIIIFIFIYFRSPLKTLANTPKVDGSFIQLDLTQNWTSDNWDKEFKYLNENNMHYLIITNTSTTIKNKSTSVYKSNISSVEKLYGSVDPLDLCLKSAEKFNIKVFIGTNFNDEWWQKSGDDSKWIYSQINLINEFCNELYSKYHSKYPNSFYGWYFPYEVDNAKFNNIKQFDVLSNALNINLKYLETKKQRLPILISPFMNSSCGSAKEYADNWAYLFSKTNFKEGDIFCPQDSIGSGRLKLEEANHWFTELKKAVSTKPGLLFWANIENFDYVNSSSVPLNKFISQMKLESSIVDNFVCFSYNHYYSPNNINEGFQKTYESYLKKGTLPNLKPQPPKELSIQTINKNEFLLSWKAPDKQNNICGYNVYRDGLLIFSTSVQRKYGGDPKGILTSFSDKPILVPNLDKCTYEVRTFDFSGNLSKPSNAVPVNLSSDTEFPNLLSKDCKYTIYPQPHSSYNDNGKKLTDGIYSNINSVKDKPFVGWYNDPIDITVDIGDIKPVHQFVVNYLREPIPWIQLPNKASLSVSSDGVNFKPIGLLRIPSVPFSDRDGSKYKIYFTLENPIDARFVRLTSITAPGTYTFIDEFEIRN